MTDTRTAEEMHPAERAWIASYRAGHITWHDAAEQAMKHLADSGDVFSSDDLRAHLDGCGEPPTPNAWGGIFISWSRQGLIRRVGGGTSTQPKRNGGHRHLWEGAANPAAEEAA